MVFIDELKSFKFSPSYELYALTLTVFMFNLLHMWMEENQAIDYVESVLFNSPVYAVKRKRSKSESDTDISPENKRLSKMSNLEDMNVKNLSDTDFKQLMLDFIIQHKKDTSDSQGEIAAIRKDLSKLQNSVVTNKHLKDVKDDVLLEVSKVNSTVTKLEGKIDELKENYDKRIKELEDRLLVMESASEKEQGEFPVDHTLVITGIPPQTNENITEKVEDLIQNGLGIKNFKCKRAARVGARDGRHGVVKVECHQVGDKITVLRKKRLLGENPATKKIFMRSSQPHEVRLIQQHTTEILKMIGKDNDFYVNSNGRLLKKKNQGEHSSSNSLLDSIGKLIEDKMKTQTSA